MARTRKTSKEALEGKSDKLSKTAEEVKAGYIWHIVSAEESAIVKLEKMAY